MFSSLTDARKWVKKKRVQKIVEMRILSLIFVFFFNDATVEERDEVSYKGNNFCYKACPVANSFFFFTLTHTHGHSSWVGKRDTRRVLLVLLHGFILVFSFFLSPWLLAFRFQRIKWHEIKSYYENFCAAFAGKREKL